MTWDFEEIKRDWIADSRIAAAPEVVVDAFNCVERIMGREWIESSRTLSGAQVRGALPTLHITAMGQKLASIEGIVGADRLIERLRQGDRSAYSELMAIYILRSRRDFIVEFYPRLIVDTTEREPDFRIRQNDDPWTYAEVAQADTSKEQEEASRVLARLTDLVGAIEKLFTLEVFLRRIPTESEVDSLAERVSQFCLLDGVRREDLGRLGFLLLNDAAPGQVVLRDHPGEEIRPMLSQMKAVVRVVDSNVVPEKHIVVRMAYADERAEEFVRDEARQLPRDAPGLIMVQTSGAPGAFKSWAPLISRRFQPTIHTRVSAVCLFSPGMITTAGGEMWAVDVRLLANPHARFVLPAPIADALRDIEEEYRRLVGERV